MKHGIESPVHLAFDNFYNPYVLGIARVTAWPMRSERGDGIETSTSIPYGFYAISVNQLYEYPWPLRDLDGTRYQIDTIPLRMLREELPLHRVGNSLLIFDANQLKTAYEATKVSLAE